MREHLQQVFDTKFSLDEKLRFMSEVLELDDLGKDEPIKGIYGVEAASLHYFDKSARYLTIDEAAQLAILLPSPRKRNPHDLTPYLQQRVAWVKRQMRQLGNDYLAPILND